MKIIDIGSTVTIEVYLGRVSYDKGNRKKHLEYERHREKEDYAETYIINNPPRPAEKREISSDSFIGRGLMGKAVGQEVEVNVGGLTVSESRVGAVSGCHLRFKIISID